MLDKESLNHSKWYCKYHVVWIPKYRKKKLFDWLRPHLGETLHVLARQKECRIEEGYLLEDHVHILISIPPKLAVSSVIGFIKGKSAIYIARNFSGRRRNFTGENLGARGFYVTTVGLDEDSVREYIKHQEKESFGSCAPARHERFATRLRRLEQHPQAFYPLARQWSVGTIA